MVDRQTAKFFGPKSTWSAARVELWEVDHGFDPRFLNAVVRGSGRVDVQRIEWQIEHRYRFRVTRGRFDRMVRALIDGHVLAFRPDRAVPGQIVEVVGTSPPVPVIRVVLANARGESRTLSLPNTRTHPVFVLARNAIRALADPEARKASPHSSRGPYVPLRSDPFPPR